MNRLIEQLWRLCVVMRWGSASAEHDVITDYLDVDPPDYRGARRAWRAISRCRKPPRGDDPSGRG